MADKRIQDLPSATNVQDTDLFVLEQNGAAMSLTGQIWINWLIAQVGGTGTIRSIEKTGTSGLTDEYTVTFTKTEFVDGNTDPDDWVETDVTYKFYVDNGNGIESIAISYGISNQGANPEMIEQWYATPIAPKDENPYQWTRIRIMDVTGAETDAYSISASAAPPTISVGSVSAESGASPDATVTNSGTAYNPVLDFNFTLPKGDKGDTGDYIDPVASFGTSTAATTEPSTWYNSPSSLVYAAGNFIWQRTEYVLHEAQTVQSTEVKIIGYIGQNGTGAGTVTQITFNGDVFTDDGTGNVTMNVNPEDVGAIADPANKSNGQVLTYDSSAGEWVASSPSTGGVNTVNNVGVTAGTTNIQLYADHIPMSASDNRTVDAAMPSPSDANPRSLGTAAAGSSGDYSRADHVHAMPTAAQVGAVSTGDVKYKMYSSVTDLGLTSGSATISGAFSALENASILLCNAGDFSSSEVPSIYGVVEIVKVTASRAYIYFYGKEEGRGDYRMFQTSNNPPSGEWVGELKTKTVTLTGSASANASLNLTVNWGTGVTPKTYFIQRVAGAANTNEIVFCEFTTATNVRVVSSRDQNVTVYVSCLYS